MPYFETNLVNILALKKKKMGGWPKLTKTLN